MALSFLIETPATIIGLPSPTIPLLFSLACGISLLTGLFIYLAHLEFNSDLLAGITILTSVILGEFLAGSLVVLMMSGGQALEAYAVRWASFALEALARRLPSLAHHKRDRIITTPPLEDVLVGDRLVIFSHETCPVEGVVVEGKSTMN